MKQMAMIALLAAAVAGCSGSEKAGSDSAISVKEAASQAEDAGLQPEAGLYRATITMTGIDIPGMPPEMAGHGGGMVTTSEYCVTKEDVAKGFEEMMKQGQSGECSYEKFDLDGGALDAVMLCKTAEGEARMAMTGTATPTTSDFTATTAMDFGPDGKATLNFAAKHERIGECPAK